MGAETLDYNQMKEVLKQPGVILLDVRGKDELKRDGKIAESMNIPLDELPTALKLNDISFKQKYGFEKPKAQNKIVVHCKSGVRAQNGAKILIEAGYTSTKVYPGILDWISHDGPVVK